MRKFVHNKRDYKSNNSPGKRNELVYSRDEQDVSRSIVFSWLRYVSIKERSIQRKVRESYDKEHCNHACKHQQNSKICKAPPVKPGVSQNIQKFKTSGRSNHEDGKRPEGAYVILLQYALSIKIRDKEPVQ